ncbi:hypothetical protein [Saccharothrix obliqua]|uniref:hypothetical protein n=1 Tax=Saccharothrix obliqua TaxID=2861747 RepID=UPI0027E309D3|nr:hypothetical protein [Saccharothrix obliqua]
MGIWGAELRVALEVPRWTWRFYLRHLPLIVGLSLVPSVQRLVAVNWGIPGGWAAASEIVVMAVRVGLVLAVGWLALRGGRATWGRFTAFATAHWRSLVWQGVLLSVAFLVFDVVAESVVGGLLPEEARQGYKAVLLFVKNPTIIALTLVWWVGLVRRTSWVAQDRRVAV